MVMNSVRDMVEFKKSGFKKTGDNDWYRIYMFKVQSWLESKKFKWKICYDRTSLFISKYKIMRPDFNISIRVCLVTYCFRFSQNWVHLHINELLIKKIKNQKKKSRINSNLSVRQQIVFERFGGFCNWQCQVQTSMAVNIWQAKLSTGIKKLSKHNRGNKTKEIFVFLSLFVSFIFFLNFLEKQRQQNSTCRSIFTTNAFSVCRQHSRGGISIRSGGGKKYPCRVIDVLNCS